MYVITNRKIVDSKSDLGIFGNTPNESGPNELRLVKVNDDLSTEVLNDTLSKSEVVELAEKYELDIDADKQWYASLQVACELFELARERAQHIMMFVHGYNNDMRDVIKTGFTVEKLYNVIVVPFSWPANGGGPVSGTLAYLSDKNDARASASALHRAVEKIGHYHRLLTGGLQKRLWNDVTKEATDNHSLVRARFAKALEKHCKTTLNLTCHSMGNYVLKYATLPSSSATRNLIFDNINLVAADVNNPEHKSWIECIPARKRLYVSINENDWALKWSRIKPGEEQRERLGSHLKNLDASNAYYIDLTRSKNVGSEHTYFKDNPTNNPEIRRVFSNMFEGRVAERKLAYDASTNVYRPSP